MIKKSANRVGFASPRRPFANDVRMPTRYIRFFDLTQRTVRSASTPCLKKALTRNFHERLFTNPDQLTECHAMNRRYMKWLLPVALFSVLAAQFWARPELRAFLSIDYWQSVLRYGKVLRIVEARYVHADDVDFEHFTDIALRESVRSLDDYSDYMVAQEYDAFNMAANQEYVGVGIEVSEFSGRVTIAQVFEQGSAEQAG